MASKNAKVYIKVKETELTIEGNPESCITIFRN